MNLSPVLHDEARLVAVQLKLLRCALVEVRNFTHNSLDHLLLLRGFRGGAEGSHRRYAAPRSTP